MKLRLAMVFVVALVAVSAVDHYIGGYKQAAILYNLAFWLAISQGCIALVAATELAEGQWIKPIKKHLLSIYPMIAFLGVMFLWLGQHWEMYPISHKHTAWFNKNFFLLRNIAFILLSFFLAWKYTNATLANKENRYTFAVLYLFAFVFSQSLLAYDAVMPLEYPWFSTIYGPYFFIEALYAGIVMASFYCLMMRNKKHNPPELDKAQYDTGVLMFGFSVLWMGFCFFQLIVIWYGNLPEEVSFYTLRLATPVYQYIGYAIIPLLFGIPFIVLISKKGKQNRFVLAGVGSIILIGLALERIFILAPIVSVSFIGLILQCMIMLVIAILVIHNMLKESLNP